MEYRKRFLKLKTKSTNNGVQEMFLKLTTKSINNGKYVEGCAWN